MTQSRKKQKPKPKNTSKKQSERFIQTAREVEADESGGRFKSIIRKILRTKYTPEK
jgi:hypothetical protein